MTSTTIDHGPANKGRKLPPEPLTAEEVKVLIRACSKRATTGIRNRALIVTLYRGGLRVSEALAVMPKDLDASNGTVRASALAERIVALVHKTSHFVFPSARSTLGGFGSEAPKKRGGKQQSMRYSSRSLLWRARSLFSRLPAIEPTGDFNMYVTINIIEPTIAFTRKPNEETRLALRENGFHWSVSRRLWYRPDWSGLDLSFIGDVCALAAKPGEEMPTAQGPAPTAEEPQAETNAPEAAAPTAEQAKPRRRSKAKQLATPSAEGIPF